MNSSFFVDWTFIVRVIFDGLRGPGRKVCLASVTHGHGTSRSAPPTTSVKVCTPWTPRNSLGVPGAAAVQQSGEKRISYYYTQWPPKLDLHHESWLLIELAEIGQLYWCKASSKHIQEGKYTASSCLEVVFTDPSSSRLDRYLGLEPSRTPMFSTHAADTVLPDAVCTNQSREIRRTFVFPQNPPDLNLQIQYGHPSICHATMLPCKCNRPSVLHGGTSVVPHIFPIRKKTAMLVGAPAAEGFYCEPTRPKASPTNEAYKIA